MNMGIREEIAFQGFAGGSFRDNRDPTHRCYYCYTVLHGFVLRGTDPGSEKQHQRRLWNQCIGDHQWNSSSGDHLPRWADPLRRQHQDRVIRNATNVTSYQLSDDPSIGSEWTTGETWTKNLTGVSTSTSVRVMVLDTASNSVVWESKMPLEVESAPSIGARGLGQSLPVIGNTTYLWAYVYDYDGIIMSVTANMSDLGQKEGNTIPMSDQGGNRWESGPLTVNNNWTGASTILTAVDDQGLTASASIRVAEESLVGTGIRRPNVSEVLHPARELIEEEAFWRHRAGGLLCSSGRGGSVATGSLSVSRSWSWSRTDSTCPRCYPCSRAMVISSSSR